MAHGTNKTWKNRSELTLDGQNNSFNQTKAVLKTGTKVTLLELVNENGNIWGRIPSGWIAFKYEGKTYVQ